jgi:pentatricopeptide repeat protein
LDLCKDLHYIIVCAGCDWIPFIETTLVHAYGSSGSIADAQAEFAGIRHPDTVSWNALLTGHASQAIRMESFELLEEMKAAGSIPDEVSFSSLLSACRHIGLMEEGLECFESMIRDYGRAADPQHCETMVDLLGRAGNFKRIENMIGNMQMNATALCCLLGACRTHGNIDLAKWAFHSALDLRPDMAKLYVMMSNIYADAESHEPSV